MNGQWGYRVVVLLVLLTEKDSGCFDHVLFVQGQQDMTSASAARFC